MPAPFAINELLEQHPTTIERVLVNCCRFQRGEWDPRPPANRRGTRRNMALRDFVKHEPPDQGYVAFEKQPKLINGTLKDYQMNGVRWLVNAHERGANSILADEMGLGKTLQTISLLAWLKEDRNQHGPHLVLAPKSTIGNWCNEIEKFCPDMKVVRFIGTKEERADLYDEVVAAKYDMLVTSYDMARNEATLLQQVDFHYLVVDEAHRLKNAESKLSIAASEINVDFRLLLTGTPLQNNLRELWSLLNFLFPAIFDDCDTFEATFNLFSSTSDNVTAAELDAKNQDVIRSLHRLLDHFMIRRSKDQVLKEIPPKFEYHLLIPMSELQKKLYQGLLAKNLSALSEQTGRKHQAKLQNLCMELRKVCNHPYLIEGVEDKTQDSLGEHVISQSGKLVFLDRLMTRLLKNGSRVLVFSQMTMMINVLEDWCSIRGYKRCRIDGQTKNREEEIERFTADGSDIPIFLLSTRAGGLGINLVQADTVVLFDSDWNPQQDLQAMDRAHRIGQTRQVRVYRFFHEHTIEERMLERAKVKLQLDKAIIKHAGEGQGDMTPDKSELRKMVQAGAASIFKSGTSIDNLTDSLFEDIMASAEDREREMKRRIQEQVSKQVELMNFSGLNDVSHKGALEKLFNDNVEVKDEDRDAIMEAGELLVAQERVRDAENAKQAPAGRRTSRGAGRGEEQVTDFALGEVTYSDLAGSVSNDCLTCKGNPDLALTSRCCPNFTIFQRVAEMIAVVQRMCGGKVNTIMLPRKVRGNPTAILRSFFKVIDPKDYQFFDREALSKMNEHIAKMASSYTADESMDPLTQALAEKSRLLDAGQGSWNRADFLSFMRSLECHGRHAFKAIADDFEGRRSISEIRSYSSTFWKRIHELSEQKRLVLKLRAAEVAHQKRLRLDCQIEAAVNSTSGWQVPSNLRLSSWSQQSVRKLFSEDEDRWVLIVMAALGYGEWDRYRLHSRFCYSTRYDWHLNSRNCYEIGRRAEMLVRHLRKDMTQDATDTGDAKFLDILETRRREYREAVGDIDEPWSEPIPSEINTVLKEDPEGPAKVSGVGGAKKESKAEGRRKRKRTVRDSDDESPRKRLMS